VFAPLETGKRFHAQQALSSASADGLSIDVEDYYHVEAFADRITPEMWSSFPSRVANNTRRTLELLESMKVRGTFFVLGWIPSGTPESYGKLSTRATKWVVTAIATVVSGG
jgi:hypothetical protein